MTTDWQANREFNSQIHNVESASLEDRRAARVEWSSDLKNPALIAERVSWLLDGNYGWGAHIIAQEVIQNKRMNRTAWLGITIAALEWQCPSNFARASWNKLSKAEQDALNVAIQAEIDSKLAEMAE